MSTKQAVEDWDDKQLEAELSVLTTIRHQNICRLYAWSFDGPRRCLVLELMAGGSVDSRLALRKVTGGAPSTSQSLNTSSAGYLKDNRRVRVYEPTTGRSKAGLAAPSLANLASWLDKNPNWEVAPGQGVANPKQRFLTWQERLQIAVGVARGIAYLHSQDPPMIHRDIKSANVLLAMSQHRDMSQIIKIADFGTVRKSEHAEGETHASTRLVAGTGAYMPPEYAALGHVSEKTGKIKAECYLKISARSFGFYLIDTFAFGIMTVELVTGQSSMEVLVLHSRQGHLLFVTGSSVFRRDNW